MRSMLQPAQLLACWMGLMSLVAFAAMGIDKHRAKSGAWRIPEARLFLWAFLGGAPGALLGMLSLRHKTRHWTFVLGFWLLSIVQLGALGFLFWKQLT